MLITFASIHTCMCRHHYRLHTYTISCSLRMERWSCIEPRVLYTLDRTNRAANRMVGGAVTIAVYLSRVYIQLRLQVETAFRWHQLEAVSPSWRCRFIESIYSALDGKHVLCFNFTGYTHTHTRARVHTHTLTWLLQIIQIKYTTTCICHPHKAITWLSGAVYTRRYSAHTRASVKILMPLAAVKQTLWATWTHCFHVPKVNFKHQPPS